jgi:hypothetical protein
MVKVHVDEWAGPERVRFTYQLQGDPVQGGGSYLATAQGPAETEVALQVRVEGGGPMAPMWEAMGRPLLPQFAKAFAGQLKASIEAAEAAEAAEAGGAPAAPTQGAERRGLLGWLRNLWAALSGRKGARAKPGA